MTASPEDTLFIKSWNNLEVGAILSAKFGPMFLKYLQNLLATFSVLLMLSLFSSTNGYVNFFFLFWPMALFKILHVCLMLVLFKFQFVLKIKPLGNSKKISLFLYVL